jgi:hypothetical protein
MMPLSRISTCSKQHYLQAAEQLVSALRVAEGGLELTTGVVHAAHQHTLARRNLTKDAFCNGSAGNHARYPRR